MRRLFIGLIIVLNISILNAEDDLIHIVREGQSMMTISHEHYGTHQKWREILEANDLSESAVISTGQKLVIPKLKGYPKIDNHSEVVANSNEVKQIKKENKEKTIKRVMDPVVVTNTKVESSVECSESVLQADKDSVPKEKFLEMKEKYLEYRAETKKLEGSIVKLKVKDERISELKQEVFDLKGQINGMKKDDMKFMESHPLYQSNLLTYSSKQILQEKSRILTQKLWLEKNKNYGKCQLNLSSAREKVSVELTKLVDYLNETYGVPNVFVTSDDHSVYFKIPGRYVYGYAKPKVTNTGKKDLFILSDYLQNLPVHRLIIHSYSKRESIKDENERRVGADEISFRRAVELQDYFLNDLGWDRRKVKSVAAGHKKTIENKYQRHFLFELVLDEYKNVSRDIASKFSDDKAINKIDKEILYHLNEPKYSQTSIINDQFNLDLSRQYFFSSQNSKLTDKGRAYLDKIFEMLSLSQEVKFRLTWTAGFQEKNYKENKRRALSQLLSIKNYVDKKFPWAKGRIELGFNNRHVKIRRPSSKNEDLYNKRITFEVIPLSLSIREFNQFETIQDEK